MGFSIKKAFGKKSVLSHVASAASGWVNDVAGAISLGTIDLENQKLNLNGKDNLDLWANSVTAGQTTAAVMGAQKPPELPPAEDLGDQQKRAEIEAAKRLEDELGTKPRGFSSTILGGSYSTDAGILQKRKLLG